MLKSRVLFFVFILCSFLVKSQDSSKVILSGSIKDSETGEGLIGATVLAKLGVGTVADLEGNFVLKLPKGDYTIEISMLGYGKYTQKLKLYSNKKIDVKLESTTLDEVEVVANIAQIRETPVAFSSISATKIQEELGSRDISMIANTTPGAYASSSGGGAGDSRVTIRGFDQRNIAVMVDGIPVNDMENGQVFWSNWDGLKDITKSVQIQRGLGASKLAVSSVGGTMNFITNGVEGKQQMVVKKEWGNNRHNLMSLAYNSGLINNKWGFTLAGTYKTGDGWVEQTFTNAYSYFAKVQFVPNSRHIISFGVNGAPQSHGQRSTKVPISVYSEKMAKKLGINHDSVLEFVQSNQNMKYTTKTQGERSFSWNPDQGFLNGETMNDKINFYHKPLVNLNHFWKISEKTTLSTVVYASFGKGGGTSFSPTYNGRDTLTGYYTVQTKYDANAVAQIDSNYSATEHPSSLILRANNNNHNWYGVLSTATSKLNKMFTLTYGVDLRYYKGIHTQTVYNLLGGQYYIEQGTNKNPNLDNKVYSNFYKKEGDIFGNNYTGLVKWGGLFLQGEFKKDKWTAFVTATGSYTGYNRIDYYKPKDLILTDTTYNNFIAYNSPPITHNGVTYDWNSPEAKTASTGWKWQLGYTIKGGANYNINDHHNVFANVGLMQIPQKFTNVFTFSNKIANDFRPQKINSFELGYGLKYNKFYGTVNAYYTTWGNQPQNTVTGLDGETYNVNGIDLVYKGIEFEGTYKLIRQIEIEGILSFGDWKYNSGGVIVVNDQNGVEQYKLEYDAKGIHVGNAAQTQAGLGVRFMPIKGLYIKPRYTYFDKNYSFFNPADLKINYNNQGQEVSDFRGRESWRLPAYGLLDLNMGYEIPFNVFKINIYGTMNNVLNTEYINDAQNNGFGNPTFSATSATVFFGTGRTFVIGTKLTF
jgi:iron complex outermembrane receptor protein